MDKDYIPSQAKFAEQHRKKMSFNGNLNPSGKRKELYDLRFDLAFNKIDFDEYNRRKQEIEAKYDGQKN